MMIRDQLTPTGVGTGTVKEKENEGYNEEENELFHLVWRHESAQKFFLRVKTAVSFPVTPLCPGIQIRVT